MIIDFPNSATAPYPPPALGTSNKQNADYAYTGTRTNFTSGLMSRRQRISIRPSDRSRPTTQDPRDALSEGYQVLMRIYYVRVDKLSKHTRGNKALCPVKHTIAGKPPQKDCEIAAPNA
jgi:hypothetical protein